MENITSVMNITETIGSLPSIPGFTTLIRIFQTAGILFIAYLIFLFFKGILEYRKFSKIKEIDKRIKEMSQTLLNIERQLTSTAKQKSKK